MKKEKNVINEMEKDLKEYTLTKGEKHKFYTVKTYKSKVKAETKTSILVAINKDTTIWINKKFASPSQYSNFITISITPDFDYDGFNKDEKIVVKGNNLIDYLDAKTSDEE